MFFDYLKTLKFVVCGKIFYIKNHENIALKAYQTENDKIVYTFFRLYKIFINCPPQSTELMLSTG
jgi:hypothetical protein